MHAVKRLTAVLIMSPFYLLLCPLVLSHCARLVSCRCWTVDFPQLSWGGGMAFEVKL